MAKSKRGGKIGAGSGSSLTAEQKTTYNQYMERIGESASRVKMVRTLSQFREDGIFLSDEQLNTQIGNALATKEADSNAVAASVDSVRFTSVPDSKGYADVEVTFKPITSYENVGKWQLGGGAMLEKKTKTLPRKTLNIKIMNT